MMTSNTGTIVTGNSTSNEKCYGSTGSANEKCCSGTGSATLIINEAQKSMDNMSTIYMKMCSEIEETEEQNRKIIPVENKTNRLNSNRIKKTRCIKAKGSGNEKRCRMIERRRM